MSHVSEVHICFKIKIKRRLVKFWENTQSRYKESYTSAPVLLNLLNDLGKVIKYEACRAFYHLFATRIIKSTIQENECYILLIT